MHFNFVAGFARWPPIMIAIRWASRKSEVTGPIHSPRKLKVIPKTVTSSVAGRNVIVMGSQAQSWIVIVQFSISGRVVVARNL